MAKPKAHSQLSICAAVAPAAVAACMMMTTELVYPTKTAVKPAEMWLMLKTFFSIVHFQNQC